MDRLLERVRRDWLRLHHGLHHGVLPGDQRLDAGRRAAPGRPRARDGRERGAAFALLFVLNNVFSGIGFALPLSFPFLQGRTGIDSHTIHVAALVITDSLGFVMPIALYLLLRNVHETIRTREARPKGMDWKPLLKFSGINGLIGLGAGFFIPLVPTWLFLKFGVADTWSG